MKKEKFEPANSTERKAAPLIGMVEWFRPGEEKRVEVFLDDIKKLGIKELRTGLSWADWYTKDGEGWYKWLLTRLSRDVNVLPCFAYIPPMLGIESKISSPPRNPKDYADFLDVIITRFGEHFEYVELWNEANNVNYWDWRLDPSWETFTEMIGKAAYWVKQRGKKTVLGGMSRVDSNWLEMMCQRNVMNHIDAVGIHGFPGTWEHDWDNWNTPISRVKEILERHGINSEIWITESGYSTWRHDEYRQLRNFASFMKAPVQRAYWYTLNDIDRETHQDVYHGDESHFHFGMKRADGTPKILYRVWEKEGLNGVQAMIGLGNPSISDILETRNPIKSSIRKSSARPVSSRTVKSDKEQILISGGAGFIGTNLAHRLLSQGKTVIVFDNLSRPGVEENLQWLCDTHGDKVIVKVGDVRNPYAVRDAVQNADRIFHFAAQVAVTTSLENPINDFEVNVRGTLNLLESVRALKRPVPLLFTSTNKVYGELDDVEILSNDGRYEPVNERIRLHGIGDDRKLDFHSPYGCSKGAADQYIKDYARVYGMPNVVFRMSCIYGPHQFGNEDQGWVAHFIIKALRGEKITIFGDGKQVRDILFADDLVDAFLRAHENIDVVQGQAFNMGGGPANTISLMELLNMIEELHGVKPKWELSDWRQGDQKYYVSDTSSFRGITGWYPHVSAAEGVKKLYHWLAKYRKLNTSGIKLKKVAHE